MGAIFKREFKTYFTSPIGYVYLALCLFFQSMDFINMYSNGYPYIEYLFASSFSIIMFTTPLLTMRLLSEDKRLKTDQLLFTAPVRITEVVLGKFLAAFAVFMMGYAMTFVFEIIIAANANIDWMVYVSNLLGVALLGVSLLGLGVFISSLTESQIVAAILSFAAAMLLIYLDSIAGMTDITVITTVATAISFAGRYSAFVEGTLDYSNILFFISFAALFLFLSVRVIDRKRWA